MQNLSHLHPAPSDLLYRPLQELRISVTDRCNFRCRYCMPKHIFDEHYPFLNHTQLLTFEEIFRLSRIFISLGVEKIRLTGGEPLLRKNLAQLITPLAKLQTRSGNALDLALTTNGILLKKQATILRQAGLKRLNISLDSLNPERFSAITAQRFSPNQVLEGIQTALDAGFATEQIKINMVVQAGVNEQDVLPMVEYCRTHHLQLRLIEYMDVGITNQWQRTEVVSKQTLLTQLKQHYPLALMPAHKRSQTAEHWQYLDQPGEIGIIPSISQPFCDHCTRARLSPDGKLFLCLFAHQGYDLTPLQEKSDQAIAQHIIDIWQQRDAQYSKQRHLHPKNTFQKIEMSYIGG